MEAKEKPVFDESIELADNAMLKVYPELFDKWDFEKNNKLGFNVYKVTKGMDVKMWWICLKKECGSSYNTTVSNKVAGRKCPYCRGLKVNETNSLLSLHPELMTEWDFEKNRNIDPSKITAISMKKAWWIGKCGHVWHTVIRSRTALKTGCPHCVHNPQVLIGFNDLWTVNPDIAKLLENESDGYKYTEGTTKKANWKCPRCNSIIKDRSVGYIVSKKTVPCTNCSDGFSFSEKLVYHLLSDNEIPFEAEKVFSWSGRIRYDFYLTDLNWIVESHGIQHYEDVKFCKSNRRGLQYQKEQDEKKKILALRNGIEKYIVIDSRESSSKFVINSIMRTSLKHLINKINIPSLEKRTASSMIIEASDRWNLGESIEEILKALKVHDTTLRIYLRKATKLGLCDYNGKESIKRMGYRKIGKQVIQLTMNLEFVREWNTLAEINRETGYSADYISKCCKGKVKSSKGFKWMFAEDYYKNKGAI